MARSIFTKDEEEEKELTQTQKSEDELEKISPIKDLKCEPKEPLYITEVQNKKDEKLQMTSPKRKANFNKVSVLDRSHQLPQQQSIYR